ncbi:MAG: D-2-hydroxyacid dehydrogenase [Caldilineaceae bacterium]|nr:D-2-hydroxyacid dehydrogenase [Caldilineaceae bacterium]
MSLILMTLESGRISEEQIDQMGEAAPEMKVVITQDRQEIESLLEEIEIVVGDLPRDLLPRAKKLRWMQLWGAGADWLMRYPEAQEMDFVLTNASGVHAIPITEHIFAFLFSLGRGFHKAMRAQVEGKWRKPEGDELFELPDKTMVLLGVGAIGQQTARIADALNMRVIGVRRDPSVSAPGVERMVGNDQLLVVLPEADFVVVTVPLTHETERMIGERELRAMKPGAYIVNIGRGKIIDQDALIRALREGWIAGAGLDVTDPEPLPADSPLWAMENVIITAHYSGLTPYYDERALEIFLDNLKRYRAGEEMRNVVDKGLGY